MLNNCASPTLLRCVTKRSFHTIGRPIASVLDTEVPVTVYEGKEYKSLKDLSNQFWGRTVTSSEHKRKVFSLLPFFAESAFTNKNFVLKLSVYPKASLLAFEVLTLDGVHTVYMPTS